MNDKEKKYILQELYEENNVMKKNIKKKDKTIFKIKAENEALEIERDELRSELNKIIYSRSYKLIKKIKSIFVRN